MRRNDGGGLGAALVGGGFAATSHLDALRRVEGATPLGVLASSPERSPEAATSLGLERGYASIDELLTDADVDVVHNCTPNDVHHAVTVAALEAGKHVLSEKPLALTLEQAEDLTARAASTDLVTGVCFTYRHFPLVQQLRSTLASGAGGAVHLVHGSYLQDWLLFDDDWNWRLESDRAGASRAVADIGSHWIDLVQYLTDAEVTRVCTRLSTLHPKRSRPSGPVQTFEAATGENRERVDVDTE